MGAVTGRNGEITESPWRAPKGVAGGAGAGYEPAKGERNNIPQVTHSQIAATMAALLGEDYHGAVPKSGEVISDAVGELRDATQVG